MSFIRHDSTLLMMNSAAKISHLDDLDFDNRFIRELPADPETANTRHEVREACYSRVLPTQVSNPQLIAYSKEVAEDLELSQEVCNTDDFVQVFSGNRLASGMEPYATCYGGHQFGVWAGQLGDGRVINLGEVINGQGKRRALQIKGAGLTPYSRFADGLAVLRSSVREFLASEAMHHLGVPTTRALSLVSTGEPVMRDMFYDGHPQLEPGAVVCRVAPSFTRFGNFQILTARQEIKLLRQFTDYTIRTDFPHLGEPSPDVYRTWFAEVCRKTAEMVVHWMRVGFVHGVMNTDNMSILGLTIDYGPYGWLDNYDPDWTPNTTDAEDRRYRFGQQPQVAYWNLGQLANAVYSLFEKVEPLQEGLDIYIDTFNHGWQSMMAAKLGLLSFREETDEQLIKELLTLLQLAETDMTLFYRKLATIDAESNPGENIDADVLIGPFKEAFYNKEQLTADYKERFCRWLRNYISRVQQDRVPDEKRRRQMNAVNPKYVLRNYLAQLAIDEAEQGNFKEVDNLLDLLHHPYDEQPGKENYAAKRPDWARDRPGCSRLSCSS